MDLSAMAVLDFNKPYSINSIELNQTVVTFHNDMSNYFQTIKRGYGTLTNLFF